VFLLMPSNSRIAEQKQERRLSKQKPEG
jgi:hypothetical protein